MAGIDRLADVLGRDNDLDAIERDNLCGDAADEIVNQRHDLEYAYRVIRDGFNNKTFDFSVLHRVAIDYLQKLEG